MQLGPLQRHHLPSGLLSTWSAAPASSQPDDRLPSPDQRGRVLGCSAKTALPEASPWIAWQVRLPYATRESVAETLRRYVDRHESLRSELELVDGDVRRRLHGHGTTWSVIDSVPQASQDRVYSDVVAHFNHVATPLGWPTFGFVTVGALAGDPEGVLLLAGFDHVSYDGVSGYRAMVEVHDLHEQVRRGEPAGPPAPSYVDHAHAEAMRARDLSPADPRLAAWKALLDGDDLAGLPTSSGVVRGERHRNEYLHLPVATSAETDELAALAKAQGCPPGVALTALFLRAVAALGDPHIHCLFSVHGRPGREWMDSAGWFAGVAPLQVRLRDTTSVTRCIEQVARAFTESTSASGLSLPTVAAALGHPVEPSMVVSYLSAASFPGHDRWAEIDCGTYVAPTPPSDQLHVWISRMPSGTALDVRAPAAESCSRWLLLVAELMRDGLLRTIGESQRTAVLVGSGVAR